MSILCLVDEIYQNNLCLKVQKINRDLVQKYKRFLTMDPPDPIQVATP
jgi:hypothetical protein